MNFYKTLVQPILGYSSAIWKPYQKQDIKKIQRRATKMITVMRNLGKMLYPTLASLIGIIHWPIE